MNERSTDFVRRSIDHLLSKIGRSADEDGFWMCYGSFVLNQQTEHSDLDLLYIHKNEDSVQRLQFQFEGYPVTVYSVSEKDFASDGIERRYGGYFAGKVLNPNVLFYATEADRDLLLRTSAEFIAPFSAAMADKIKRIQSTSENVLADSVLARLQYCPWYRSYFVRYYMHPEFRQIWSCMKELLVEGLVKANVVTVTGDLIQYKAALSESKLHIETLKIVARFWGVGSSLHSNMLDFPSQYMHDCEQHIRTNELEETCLQMQDFLHAEAKRSREVIYFNAPR